jgi:hypothetical protein
VTGEHQDETNRRRGHAIEGEDGMRGAPREKSAGARRFERPVGEPGRRTKREEAETRHQERVRGNAERREELGDELFVRAHEWLQRALVHGIVGAERGRRLLERRFEHHRVTVVEGVRERRGGDDPFEAEVGEWKGAKNRRRCSHRVDRRTDVVMKAG